MKKITWVTIIVVLFYYVSTVFKAISQALYKASK
jgi:hypothetical protein